MNILFFLTPKAMCAYIESDDTLRQAMERMEHSGYAALPVLDKSGKYCGVVTEGDLLWTLKRLCVMDLRQTEEHSISEIEHRRTVQPVRVDTRVEDLISVGTIGLIKAINTFDHTRCARLSTYAARCIDNELLMMFRAKKKYSREISLYEPIGTDKEGNEISLLDIVESPPVDIVEQYSVREDIRFLLCALKDTLSQKEYQVICLRYGLFGIEQQTQKEVADILGISQSYISRLEKKIISRLKKEINKMI